MINSTTLTNLTTSTNFRHSSLHLTVSTNSPLQYHSLFIIFPFVLNPRSIRRTLNPKLKDHYHCWRRIFWIFSLCEYDFLLMKVSLYFFLNDQFRCLHFCWWLHFCLIGCEAYVLSFESILLITFFLFNFFNSFDNLLWPKELH
jgi:hypothetical protein